jgi:hypothetical protein
MKQRPGYLHPHLLRNSQHLGGLLGPLANRMLLLRLHRLHRLNKGLGCPRASRPPDEVFLLLRLILLKDRGSSGWRGACGRSAGCRGGGSNDGLLSLGNKSGMIDWLLLAEVGLLEHGPACSAHAGRGLAVGKRRHIYWGWGNWCSGGIGGGRGLSGSSGRRSGRNGANGFRG